MKYTLKEWREKGAHRFGENHLDWKFVCPACGRVNTGHEFKEAGARPDDMAVTCIGRHNGKGVSGMKCKKSAEPPKHGCDWAAFGLFGTLNGGDVVAMPDGKELAVFEYAEVNSQ